MRLLDLFRKTDPSESWPVQRIFIPALDLRDFSLNSVPLGGPVEALQGFGKPDNPRPLNEGRFVYAHSGVYVETVLGKVGYVAIALEDDPLDNLKGTSAKLVRPDGGAMELSSATHVDALRDFLGIEPETDIDDVEILDVYEIGPNVLEVEARLDGGLKRVNLY